MKNSKMLKSEPIIMNVQNKITFQPIMAAFWVIYFHINSKDLSEIKHQNTWLKYLNF